MKDSTNPLAAPGPRARPSLGLEPPTVSPSADRPPGPEAASFVDYLYGAVRRARWIGLNMLLVGLVAAITSLFLPQWYRAHTSFLPAQEERSAFSITAFLRDVAIPGGGLSDAMQAGDLSAALLASRRVRGPLVSEFDLVDRYRVRDVEDAMSTLGGLTGVFVGQEGLVTLSIEDREPEMAARMVNRALELLDEFNADQRMTRGHRTRIFVERELAHCEEELRAAEEALERYQTETRLLPLSIEVQSTVTSSANLLARKLELEIELELKEGVLREGNAELERLRKELATIDGKLGELPAIGLKHARLVRDLKVRETVYGFLRTEYEQAKIQEERDTPSITVVDEAEPPLRRSRPRRTRIVLTAVGVAGVISLLGAFVATWFEFLPAGDRRRETVSALGRDLRGFLRPRRRRRS